MGAIRKFKREVARNQMKRQGLRNTCKRTKGIYGKKMDSWFSQHWKEFVPAKEAENG